MDAKRLYINTARCRCSRRNEIVLRFHRTASNQASVDTRQYEHQSSSDRFDNISHHKLSAWNSSSSLDSESLSNAAFNAPQSESVRPLLSTQSNTSPNSAANIVNNLSKASNVRSPIWDSSKWSELLHSIRNRPVPQAPTLSQDEIQSAKSKSDRLGTSDVANLLKPADGSQSFWADKLAAHSAKKGQKIKLRLPRSLIKRQEYEKNRQRLEMRRSVQADRSHAHQKLDLGSAWQSEPQGNKTAEQSSNRSDSNFQDLVVASTEAEAEAEAEAIPSSTKTAIRVQISESQSVTMLSRLMRKQPHELINAMKELGIEQKSANDFLDEETARDLVEFFGNLPDRKKTALERARERQLHDKAPRRGPVICVAGHVDHGKTTLLDALRSSNLASKEAGGITQAIGAFKVPLFGADLSDRSGYATFLDTPGHAAFANLRRRGINNSCVDIMVLVVSAVDGVKQQTIESINLAHENNIPIVVALNKCDMPNADTTKVKRQLLSNNVMVEELGGDVQVVEISALKRMNLDLLAESIAMVSEVNELRAPVDVPAQCYVVESRIEREHGCVINLVVRSGTLSVGDYFVSGSQWGRVRALLDENRNRIQSVEPSVGAQLIGASSLDGLSSELIVTSSEDEAQTIIAERTSFQFSNENVEGSEDDANSIAASAGEVVYREKREGKMRVAVKALSEEDKAAEKAAEERVLSVIVKSDVNGALEALLTYFDTLPTDRVSTKVLRSGIGEITEADLIMAQETRAVILGYGISAPDRIAADAKLKNIEIYSNPIIYNIMDYVKQELGKRLPSITEQRVVGELSVIQPIGLNGRRRGQEMQAAGCQVTMGTFYAKNSARVLRNRKVIVDNAVILSLKHFKSKVDVLQNGEECGVVIEGYSDVRVGDIIENVETVSIPSIFDDSLARGEAPVKSNSAHFADAYFSKSATQ